MQDATTVIVSVADLTDATGLPVALGRAVSFSARIDVVITVSPANATVSPGGTIDYVADADGLNPSFAWTVSGGTITPGPSATATYTAGSLAGLFAVTATSVDVSHPVPDGSGEGGVRIAAGAARTAGGLLARVHIPRFPVERSRRDAHGPPGDGGLH